MARCSFLRNGEERIQGASMVTDRYLPISDRGNDGDQTSSVIRASLWCTRHIAKLSCFCAGTDRATHHRCSWSRSSCIRQCVVGIHHALLDNE